MQPMDSSMEWKEAQGSSENFEDSNDEVLDQISVNNDNENDVEYENESFQGTNSNIYHDTRPFPLQNLNLRLLRNISALSDAAQHKSKPHYAKESSETFDSWLKHALVAISPNADVILFADRTCDKEVYLAKLKLEPIDQYVIKKLSIPLDYDEEITSLLCLSIMSTQKTSLGSVDWNALVIGLSSGYVKFYTEQSNCLLTLKFCDEPVVDLRCQTQRFPCTAKSQAHFASIVDEMLIIYRSAAIVLDGIGLYENLRLAKADILANSSDYDPAYNITNLPSILTCQRWSIETSRVISGDILGIRCTNQFDSLRSSSIDSTHLPSKANARTIAIVGSDPFMSCYRESKESTTHSYKEMITSLLPFWSKSQPTRLQLNAIEASSNICLFDKGRVATSFVPSPDKRLAIITDNFGRVLLVDVTNWIVVRIWKGYRDAECGWIETKKSPESNSSQDSPSAFFVAIYAPRRGLLEIWLAQRGPRVAAFNVGKGCVLLYCGYMMLNMRADSMSKSSCNINSSHCFLLNANSETLFVVDVPYSYSLHKESDQKSRDNLLIEELLHAIQQDLEVCAISEVMHRIELPQSLEIAINHIAIGLRPKKIVNILENLINKFMTSYNNHSGQGLTIEDRSILELCRRVIRLCSLFEDMSKSPPNELTLPELNQRLIEQYEEHPNEIDDFSEKLNWASSEVLRYLSLLSLERSFRSNQSGKENPWPNLGEPLSWREMISCFDLKLLVSKSDTEHNLDKLSIRLKSFDDEFLRQDQVLKTAIFLYNRMSEAYFRSSTSGFAKEKSDQHSTYNYIEPSSRLALLFQFWLSTSLCNHWKMWAFLQEQVGQMSDELKVLVMTHEDDQIIVDTWKQIYQLILESDNHFAAMIATNVIKNDTLRLIEDNQKAEKLRGSTNEEDEGENLDSSRNKSRSSVDWECLCIDAERMSILGQQLEDVFLLELLLNYSPNSGALVGYFQYKISRRTVASLLRAGPAVVSELIAQWAAQTDVSLKIFTQPYGVIPSEESDRISIATARQNTRRRHLPLTPVDNSSNLSGEEHSKELLHHIKTSFPCSLNSDIILLNCVWEFCHRWTNATGATVKAKMLKKCREALDLLNDVRLRHSVSGLAFKTFFQRTFERFVWLVETNATMLGAKSWRTRDNLTRKDLNMSEDCLQDFVDFCCELTELMVQTNSDTPNVPVSDDPVVLQQQKQQNASEENLDADEGIYELNERLLDIDEWWSTPNMDTAARQRHPQEGSADDACLAMYDDDGKHCPGSSAEAMPAIQVQRQNLLATIALSKSSVNRFDVDTLIDLNRLANIMYLALRLNIIRPYPLTLIGEESRKHLRLDLLQSPKSGADIRIRMGSLDDLRHKFVRRCILGIVANMTDESMMQVSYGDLSKDNDTISQATGITQQKSMGSSDQQSTASTITTGTMTTIEKILSKDKAKRERNDWSDSDSNDSSGYNIDGDADDQKNNNELMLMFGKLLSLASEWQLDLDELQMELVFELYRNNYDGLAGQISTRVRDTRTLATGLLKIASQRILVLFGLSPHISLETSWKDRADKWSLFAPNVGQWLRSIQHEEMRRELASLVFSDSLRPNVDFGCSKTTATKQQPDDEMPAEISLELSFGLRLFVLDTLRHRTKLLLECTTNHLDGQAGRLAYDLLQLLESRVLNTFLAEALAQVS